MSTKEEILDYVMDSPSNTNRSVLDSLLNNFAGEKEIQYVDFTLADGSITAPADDTVLTICNMDDSNVLVVARILSGGFIYYMPLTWRASPGNIIHVAFSISSNGYNRQLTGQHYPNNTEKWSYSSEIIDYIPDEGNVGDVLKKTATGCEWGAASGGSESNVFVIPIIPGDSDTYTTTTACGELKAAVDAGKVVIMALQNTDGAGNYPMLAETRTENYPEYSYTGYYAIATLYNDDTLTATNEDGEAEIPDADPLVVRYMGGGPS